MQDSDIIKALECCKSAIATGCKGCPLYNTEKTCTCVTVLSENAFDLINRQKEEIERLHTMNSEQRIGANVLKRTAVTKYMQEVKRRCIKSGLYPVIIKNILHNVKEDMVGE
jgi:hypothetical protein